LSQLTMPGCGAARICRRFATEAAALMHNFVLTSCRAIR
jgi:hypothetical protein